METKNNSQEYYNSILNQLSEEINSPDFDFENYDSNFGNEATVFFVSEDLALKVFEKPEKNFIKHFDSYCREIQSFANKGYAVPKIYAWKNDGSNLYLLEERVKGRELYIPNLESIYPEFSENYTLDEFKQILLNEMHGGGDGFNLFYKAFIDDYIKINKNFESLPESIIENIIMDIYNMFTQGQYSVPDLYGRNIIFDGQNFAFIDHRLVRTTKRTIKLTSEYMPGALSAIFRMNKIPKKIFTNYIERYKISEFDYAEIRKKIAEVKKTGMAGLDRFFKVSKKLLDLPKLKDKNWLISEIARTFGSTKDAYNLVKEM